ATLLTFPAGRGGEYAVVEGTARIGYEAFTGASLTSLSLPGSVTNVGEYARSPDMLLYNKELQLSGCPILVIPGMTNIIVAAENPVYRDIGGVLTSKDGTTLLAFPAARGGKYSIPSGVTLIGEWAFAGCSSLTAITIPDSVTTIGASAFRLCAGLTDVTFGAGTVDIGNVAFFRCGVTSVTIPDSVASIGDGAFVECASLTNVVFGDGVTNIGYGAFGDCDGLASVTLPGGVTHVGDYAFFCVTYVGDSFSGSECPTGSMTSAVMSNVRVMGPNTFGGQPLTEVVFTGAEPPRIVGEFWTQTNGVYSNWVGDAGADWEFPTWEGKGDFTVLVPAAYLNNWVADVADPVWRGRPVQTLESAWGISGTFDVAVDDRWGLEWTTAGWFAQSAVCYSGPMALQSGDILNGQTSSVQTTVKNAGTLTFRYRVSTEEDYDFLNVYLDDALILQDSGERADWLESRIVVRGIGKHKIRWDYVKDDSYSEGEDCAWIDAVVWEPGTAGTEVPVPYAWLDGFGLSAWGGYEEAAFADADGDGYPSWEEYVAGTDPTNRASVFTAFISLRDGIPSVTWDPDLRPERIYTVEGTASLTGADWQSPTNATHRFFRVKVSMP
ncbi:MAG: leucine-rich repeat domain-containing protein, partial [Kiritimatiellae bacterium]|nr:leucine-rich repeat domain-containing protein [Kiritimatiellia bacterium]